MEPFFIMEFTYTSFLLSANFLKLCVIYSPHPIFPEAVILPNKKSPAATGLLTSYFLISIRYWLPFQEAE